MSLIAENFPDAPKAIAVKCDVGKEADVVGLVKKAVEWGGRLDVMFNKYGYPEKPGVLSR